MDPSNTSWEWPRYTKTIHRASYPAIDPKNPSNSAADKVVVVTGGGTGIGKGISKGFVQAGAKAVVILGRREDILKSAQAELEKEGQSKILYFVADVVDQDALEKAFESTEKQVGKIDVVIANAGYLSAPALATTTEVDDWWKSFEVNIKGTLLTFRAFIAHKGNNSPTFVSLNSGAAHAGAFASYTSYQASKGAQAQLIACLQVEHPDVRVVSMHPGVIESDMYTKSQMPLTPDNPSLPSSFAVWLASPSAEWVGGRFLWSHWDVEELAQMKDEIKAKNELAMGLQGWPKEGEPVVVW